MPVAHLKETKIIPALMAGGGMNLATVSAVCDYLAELPRHRELNDYQRLMAESLSRALAPYAFGPQEAVLSENLRDELVTQMKVLGERIY